MAYDPTSFLQKTNNILSKSTLTNNNDLEVIDLKLSQLPSGIDTSIADAIKSTAEVNYGKDALDKSANELWDKIYNDTDQITDYYTLDLFKLDTGDDYEKQWAEAFINKSTNFEQGKEVSSEVSTDSEFNTDLAKKLYKKAQGTGEKIMTAYEAKVKAEVAQQIADYTTQKAQQLPGEIAKYIKDNALTPEEAWKQVRTEAEQEQIKKDMEEQDENDQKIEEEKQKIEKETVEKEKKAEEKKKKNAEESEKHCYDSAQKVVTLVNNSILEHIRRIKDIEEDKFEQTKSVIDTKYQNELRAQALPKIEQYNKAALNAARAAYNAEQKAKQLAKIVADKVEQVVKLNLLGKIGAAAAKAVEAVQTGVDKVQGAIDTATGAIQTGVDAATGAVSSVASAATGAVSSVANTAKSAVSTAAATAKSAVSTAAATAKSTASTAAATAKSTVSTAASTASTAAATARTTVTNAV